MKVRELIEKLQAYDGDAEVILATNAKYPMEATVSHLVQRSAIEVPESFRELHSLLEEDAALERSTGKANNDVLLCEGRHLRYGDRYAWK